MTTRMPQPRFVHFGYGEMSLSLRWTHEAPGRAEVRLSMAGPGSRLVWGEPHPGAGAGIDAVAALRWLATNWARLAKPFLDPEAIRDPVADCTLDLAQGFGLRGATPVLWTVRNGRVEVISGERSHAFGRETILAVEILSGFASALADGLRAAPCEGSAAVVESWDAAFAATDVLPWAADDLGAEAPVTGADRLEQELREARFYCRRLGVDLDRYVRASAWLTSEQGRFATGGRPEGEPDWSGIGFDAAAVLDLPALAELEARTPVEVRALYADGSADWDAFVAAALATRNGDLRRALWFKTRD